MKAALKLGLGAGVAAAFGVAAAVGSRADAPSSVPQVGRPFSDQGAEIAVYKSPT
jgi:hypothetical protein